MIAKGLSRSCQVHNYKVFYTESYDMFMTARLSLGESGQT